MKGIDIVIDKIKTAMATLSWIEMSYGRAYLLQEKRDGKVNKFPMVWDKGEYQNVLDSVKNPIDKFKGLSFVACRGPEKPDSTELGGFDFKSRDISLICWINQSKISNNGEYIIAELQSEVEKVLAIPEIQKITNIYDEKADDIFAGYTIDDVNLQYLTYPYGGLRFDFTVKYRETCQ